jgi:hypothetical protein
MELKQAGQIIVQGLALAQSKGCFELHVSALLHQALTVAGPHMGLVPEQVPATVAGLEPAPANE